jgi:hypothetical protein
MCEQTNVTPRHCATNSRPPPMTSPSNGYGSTLEWCTDDDQVRTPVDAAPRMTRVGYCPPTSALCGHRQHCASLRRSVRMGQHHSSTCAANSCPSPVMRPSNGHGHTLDGCTDDDRARTQVKATTRNHSRTDAVAATTPAEAGTHHQPMPGARICKDNDLA